MEVHEEVQEDDFRMLSIKPTFEELSQNIKPKLRKIKKPGKFDDEQHYLDVNFKLLKEEFSRDLREGLASYRDRALDKNLIDNVYENVCITGFFANQESYGLEL